jgi:hypothetical protein
MLKVQNLFLVTLILQFIGFVFLFINNSISAIPQLVQYFCMPILVFNSPLLMASSLYLLVKNQANNKLAAILGLVSGLIGTLMVIGLIIALKKFN